MADDNIDVGVDLSNHPIMTRAQAQASGCSRYFTGKPCIRGHVDERFTKRKVCVSCNREDRQKWWVANPEKKKEFTKKSAQRVRCRNPDLFALRARERMSVWRKRHIEVSLERGRAAHRKRYKENPQYYISASRNRKAKLRFAIGRHSAMDVEFLIKKQSWKCAYCRICIKNARHVDHIVPLSKGGRNDIRNIQILCPTCNLKKQDDDPLHFARKMGLLL